MSFNILQLGTYPIRKPLHGGQRRVAALYRAYRDSGITSQYVACYSPGNYPPELAGENDLPARLEMDGNFEDLLIGESFLQDARSQARFLAAWERANPQVVSFEQPYLWPLVRQLLAQQKIARPKLVYSSQNVETELKAEVYQSILPPEEAIAAVARVREIEDDLVRQADMVIAVSEDDALKFRKLGAGHCVVVRNGGEFKTAGKSALEKWTKIFTSVYKTKRACFVGSFHMPNLTGLMKMIGPSMGFLPPECEVVVAGGICQLLANNSFYGEPGGINRSRLHLVGQVEDDDLAAIFQCCDAVLLPIVSGGGSNLKTVEALLSKKPVVATDYSFRSYQEYSALPQVFINDDPREYKRLLRAVLHERVNVQLTAADEAKLRELTWTHTGKGLVLAVRQLMA